MATTNTLLPQKWVTNLVEEVCAKHGVGVHDKRHVSSLLNAYASGIVTSQANQLLDEEKKDRKVKRLNQVVMENALSGLGLDIYHPTGQKGNSKTGRKKRTAAASSLSSTGSKAKREAKVRQTKKKRKFDKLSEEELQELAEEQERLLSKSAAKLG